MIAAVALSFFALAARAADAPKQADKKGAAAGFVVFSIDAGTLKAGGKTLKAGDALALGERVRLSSGTAVIKYGDVGRLLLKGPASFAPKASGVQLSSGGLLTVLLRAVNGYWVSAGPITAAVRGTHFFIEARGAEAYLCLCDGAVEVSGRPGAAKEFKSSLKTDHKHAAQVFKLSGGRISQEKAGLEDHSDAEIDGLLKPVAPPR